MDKNLLTEKLNMWRGKLIRLEEEHVSIMVRKGEAAAMGDLRENAAYQTLVEDSETWRVKISEVKKIIAKIEEEIKSY